MFMILSDGRAYVCSARLGMRSHTDSRVPASLLQIVQDTPPNAIKGC